MPRVPLIVIPPEELYELLLEELVPIPISYEEWLRRVTDAGMLRGVPPRVVLRREDAPRGFDNLVALAKEYGTIGIGGLPGWNTSTDDLSSGDVKRTRSA
jgi:hypothetical protein